MLVENDLFIFNDSNNGVCSVGAGTCVLDHYDILDHEQPDDLDYIHPTCENYEDVAFEFLDYANVE
jgi:hypothetical protein